jgi:predicted N-acetyltransferase YhbS
MLSSILWRSNEEASCRTGHIIVSPLSIHAIVAGMYVMMNEYC